MRVKNLRLPVLFGVCAILLSACTENQRARNFGGTQTIDLPVGKKLITAAWKNDDLWYSLRPMREGETADTVEFIEDSSYGIMNGRVVFIEHAPPPSEKK